MNIFGFFVWLIRSAVKPIDVLLSNWRSYPSLRIYYLLRYLSPDLTIEQSEKLERLYRDFENWESRQRYRKGSFDEFEKLLSHKNTLSQYGDFRETAKIWKMRFARHYFLRNAQNLLAILVVTAFVSTLVRAALWASRVLLDWLQLASFVGAPHAAFTVGILFLISWLFWRVAGDRISDVVTWTLDTESDARFAVRENRIKKAQALIRDILADEDCDECIVIGHSLGSAIAAEAILREGERATASNLTAEEKEKRNTELSKVKYIFCVGSPIESIFLYFQEDRTFSHRFNRLNEERRLSISLPPFRHDGQDGEVKLVNFWSRYDPISSPIFSLRKKSAESSDAVKNVESLPSRAPLPIGAHTSFFQDPKVVKSIYWAIMAGKLPKEFETGEKEVSVPIAERLAFLIASVIFCLVLIKIAFFGGGYLVWMLLGAAIVFLIWAAGALRKALGRRHLSEGESFLDP
ncbi:hypothetical protein KUV28_17530 [Ferrimonas balearica]|nr:hypothetical protein [Ferrimonas balearica]